MRGITRVARAAWGPALLGGAAALVVFAADKGEPARRAGTARMISEQIEARGVTDPLVLDAMRRVPRHRFVPGNLRDQAYEDTPLPIGEGQTISQPYVVAHMTALLRPRRGMKVLEVGTGSGYQAAVLAACGCEVYSVEVIPDLGHRAGAVLKELGYTYVHVRIGDGFDGWPEHAPYDGVMLTAAPEEVPPPLTAQLREGGRLVAPVGKGAQQLVVITKTAKGLRREFLDPVRFVPMTGKAAGAGGGSGSAPKPKGP